MANNSNNIFNSLSIEDCLDEWVHEHRASVACRKKITSVLRTIPPVTMTLYRGHKNARRTIENSTWWATSTSRKLSEKFSNGDCCVFKIYVKNVPALRVNDYLEESHQFKKEKEYLLLGGGTFYQNKDMTTPGFKLLNDGTYVAWYSHPDYPINSSNKKNNNHTRKRRNNNE